VSGRTQQGARRAEGLSFASSVLSSEPFEPPPGFELLLLDVTGSIQVGASGDTWIVSVTAGPGAGGGISWLSTMTAAKTLTCLW
jgi:hypothetical protein